MTCWLASLKAEHQVLLCWACAAVCVCVRVCIYMQGYVLEITVWIKKSTQWETKVKQCAEEQTEDTL